MRARIVSLLLAAVLAPVAVSHAQPATPAKLPVETSRPAREPAPTLRYLKANVEALRARVERWKPVSRVHGVLARPLDPRFLDYRGMLAEIAAAKDSVAVAAESRERKVLFERVTELAEFERELDQMEGILAAQAKRLGVLHADFAGRQRTELAVLLTGGADAGRVDSVVVRLEDGTRVVTGLDDAQRRSLQVGGLYEVFRGRVEPREQVVELRFVGEGWDQAAPGFVRLTPARDQLTFVQLDLTRAAPARGMSSVSAGTWRLDAPAPARSTADADQARP
jgi:hypothetical protein